MQSNTLFKKKSKKLIWKKNRPLKIPKKLKYSVTSSEIVKFELIIAFN